MLNQISFLTQRLIPISVKNQWFCGEYILMKLAVLVANYYFHPIRTSPYLQD